MNILLDLVNKIFSSCTLTNIPSDIANIIIEYISPTPRTIIILSLINKECKQLVDEHMLLNIKIHEKLSTILSVEYVTGESIYKCKNIPTNDNFGYLHDIDNDRYIVLYRCYYGKYLVGTDDGYVAKQYRYLDGSKIVSRNEIEEWSSSTTYPENRAMTQLDGRTTIYSKEPFNLTLNVDKIPNGEDKYYFYGLNHLIRCTRLRDTNEQYVHIYNIIRYGDPSVLENDFKIKIGSEYNFRCMINNRKLLFDNMEYISPSSDNRQCKIIEIDIKTKRAITLTKNIFDIDYHICDNTNNNSLMIRGLEYFPIKIVNERLSKSQKIIYACGYIWFVTRGNREIGYDLMIY